MESERDMYRQFQDWCLRTYGDSGKTKTVTRKKYERIVQLLNGSESSSTDNAKFKFWVKSKGFQLGQPDEVRGGGGGAKQVLFVRVKTTDTIKFCCENAGGETQDKSARLPWSPPEILAATVWLADTVLDIPHPRPPPLLHLYH
ncbi:nucleolar protein 4-like [Mus caroli]|uniref:Nucleolar protein 4-like n=1 Tax=Mus caroli TaxID=10089 RepID=A0A6P7QN55_MUSCR|nr:nucleolar protein 4-like [Mus caroli]